MNWPLITRTTFLTTLASYLMFLLAEYFRPGFVSFIFSVHWFLLPLFVFALLWMRFDSANMKTPRVIKFVLFIITSLLLFILVWRETEVLADARVFLALIAALTPWIIERLLSAEKE